MTNIVEFYIGLVDRYESRLQMPVSAVCECTSALVADVVLMPPVHSLLP